MAKVVKLKGRWCPDIPQECRCTDGKCKGKTDTKNQKSIETIMREKYG